MVGYFLWFALVLAAADAAQGAQYFVSPDGSDANDCLTIAMPCKTAKAVTDRMPLVNLTTGRLSNNLITFAAGVYHESVNISHLYRLSLSGPAQTDGSCRSIEDARTVTLDEIRVEDHATLWAGCLSVGMVSCRQGAIVDLQEIAFDGSKGIAIEAAEACTKFNCASTLWLDGAVQVFARVSAGATFEQACDVNVTRKGLTVIDFMQSRGGRLELGSGTYSGEKLAAGKSLYLDGGSITYPRKGGSRAIPGDGAIYGPGPAEVH